MDTSVARSQGHLSPQSSHGHRAIVAMTAAIAAIGGMLFGYDTGVISGALLFIQQEFRLDAFAQEIVVSSVLVGALLSAGIGGRLADTVGRRLLLIITAVIFSVGALASAWAPSIPFLVGSRFVVGLGIGFASFTVPLYISELAPPESRGWLVSLNQLAITSGIVISYLVDYAFAGPHQWRWMLGLAVVPGVALGVGMLLLPETPRWLASHQGIQAARSSLQRIRGQGEDIGAELRDIQQDINQRQAPVAEVFRPAYRMALIVGVGLAIFQQITGINTVIYYAPTILRTAGFSSASGAILATLGVGIVNVLSTIVSLRVIDRVGRRPLLLWGLIGMGVSILLLGLVFALPSLNRSAGIFAVVLLMAYVAAFAISLGPIFWLMIAEIYPQKVRGSAMGIATMANWGANLIVALTFLSLIQAFGRSVTFWIFGVFCIAALFFVQRLVPETKGRSLEEIERSWKR